MIICIQFAFYCWAQTCRTDCEPPHNAAVKSGEEEYDFIALLPPDE